MNIAIVTPYGEVYYNDKLFNPESCKIGQNLLLPGIKLKDTLEKLGHHYHTADVYPSTTDIDVWVFQDLSNNSIITSNKLIDKIKYVIKRKWKNDYLYKYIHNSKEAKAILIMQEPSTVFPQSYKIKNHKYFDRILTWNDSLVDNKKYFKFIYPQVKPAQIMKYPYEKKFFMTMICGNKRSKDKNELYSERLKLIDFFEKNEKSFDLFGFGWDAETRISYRGKVEDKLKTMSKYKFSICFENMKSDSGYITEKIFDCFFAGCIPIYYGASDILEYIPENTFIDYRKFKTMDELYDYLKNMSQEKYEEFLENINKYLLSDMYENIFSIKAYVNRMVNTITRWNE